MGGCENADGQLDGWWKGRRGSGSGSGFGIVHGQGECLREERTSVRYSTRDAAARKNGVGRGSTAMALISAPKPETHPYVWGGKGEVVGTRMQTMQNQSLWPSSNLSTPQFHTNKGVTCGTVVPCLPLVQMRLLVCEPL